MLVSKIIKFLHSEPWLSECLSCTYTTCCNGAQPVSFPVQPFQGGAGSSRAERRQSQQTLEVVSWASAESLQSLHGRLWLYHKHLSPPGHLHPRQSPGSSSSSAPGPQVQALPGWGRIVRGLEKYGPVLTQEASPVWTRNTKTTRSSKLVLFVYTSYPQERGFCGTPHTLKEPGT